MKRLMKITLGKKQRSANIIENLRYTSNDLFGVLYY